MAATGFTPISLYYSTTAAAVPTAGNLVPGELAININDGKLYYENSSGVVTLLASTSGASGDVVGPASATDNAIARFDLTTGKLIQNSVVTIADTTGNMAGVGTLSSGAITTTGVLTLPAGTVSAPAITTTGDTNTGIFFPAADTIAFTEGGVEAMRITSAGNVGIGTSTPSFKLAVSGSDSTYIGVTSSSGGTGSGLYTANATNAYFIGAGAASGGSGLEFRDATNGVTRMVIDSAGSVGIGTSGPSAQLQVAGSSSVSALKVPNIEEVATISATAATGTINYDITTQSVLFYTSNASANWTVNFRGSSGTSLNTLMQTGESMSCSFLVTQGATAYYNSAVQVDGTTSGVTTRWQGSAPTSGNASSLDSYTYVIIKTANATFTVLATQTKFA